MANIVILTAGTYGDVVPHVGLGQRLSATGHRVTVGTTARFAATITAAGLAFQELPASDPREVAATERGEAASRAGLPGMLSATRTAAEIMRRPIPAMIDIVESADVVLCTAATSLLAAPIAEARGLPCVVLSLQPIEPTRTHGPALLGGRNLGGPLNRAVPAMFARLGFRFFSGLVADLRTRLDLPPTPASGYRPDELTLLHGISPTVYPRPIDWRAGVDVVGYWWPPAPAEGWQPDPALTAFLADGSTPVYVGFGSMGTGDGPRLSHVVRQALDLSGRRAIVARGWAELTVEGPDVLTVDDVPHSWLFPQVAAVVHHGGAGTTAAGLRAGVPAVPVPFGYDQPFWARRLTDLGVAPRALPARRITGEQLAASINDAVTDAARRNDASSLAEDLASEDGAARVVDLIADLHRPSGTDYEAPAAVSPMRKLT